MSEQSSALAAAANALAEQRAKDGLLDFGACSVGRSTKAVTFEVRNTSRRKRRYVVHAAAPDDNDCGKDGAARRSGDGGHGGHGGGAKLPGLLGEIVVAGSGNSDWHVELSFALLAQEAGAGGMGRTLLSSAKQMRLEEELEKLEHKLRIATTKKKLEKIAKCNKKIAKVKALLRGEAPSAGGGGGGGGGSTDASESDISESDASESESEDAMVGRAGAGARRRQLGKSVLGAAAMAGAAAGLGGGGMAGGGLGRRKDQVNRLAFDLPAESALRVRATATFTRRAGAALLELNSHPKPPSLLPAGGDAAAEAATARAGAASDGSPAAALPSSKAAGPVADVASAGVAAAAADAVGNHSVLEGGSIAVYVRSPRS